jgi:diguanylate cyclase (GGDEF)-like protein
MDGVVVGASVLDTMLPLHMRVAADGQILSSGRTFRKLMDRDDALEGSIFDVLTVKRPAGVENVPSLLRHQGESLSVQLNEMPEQNMKAVAAAMPDGGFILNLSLGAGVMDVVNARNLKNKDFSPADPTVEMIYMIEVQSILYQQHKQQSHRLQGAKVHAEEQAFTDALTGLANRRALEKHLARLLRRSKGSGFALMQIDLDFFKAVNDTHGHAAGDFVLQETSRLLLNQMRATDMVSRIGGDEFVIVMSEYGDAETLAIVGSRIIEAVRAPIDFEGIECKIGASIGATIVERGSERTPEQILSDADRALYVSKEQGRGLYHLDVDISGATATNVPH